MRRLLMLSIVLLAVVRVASAATYYVATTGSDTSACTLAAPCATFAHVLHLPMVAGDILYIRGGTYDQALDNTNDATLIPSGTDWTSPVTIAGYPGETVILNRTISATTGNPVSYVIFDHLIISARQTLYTGGDSHHIRFTNGEIGRFSPGCVPNGTAAGNCGCSTNCVEGGASFVEVAYSNIHDSGPCDSPVCDYLRASYGFYMTGHDNYFHHNTVHDNSGYAFQIYNSGHTDVSNNVVSNNLVYGNGFNDPSGNGNVGGMVLSSGSNNIAYNNVLYHNGGAGIQMNGGGTNGQAYNNTIFASVGYGLYVAGGAPIIKNNIIYGNGFIARNDDAGTVMSNNLCDAMGTFETFVCAFGGDPRFRDPINGDFTILQGSPAQNNGLDLTSLGIFTTDFNGNTRPSGAPWDIGAYQVAVTNVPATPSNLREVCDNPPPAAPTGLRRLGVTPAIPTNLRSQ